MRLIRNAGGDRVIDELRKSIKGGGALDIASPEFSLFAYSELRPLLDSLRQCRLILPSAVEADLGLLGSERDRALRNRLQVRWLAKQCARWMLNAVEFREAPALLPQSIFVTRDSGSGADRVITGNSPFTTEGLGLGPGNQLSLIQCAETPEEWELLSSWFAMLWNGLPSSTSSAEALPVRLDDIAAEKPAHLIYQKILSQIFSAAGEELDEDKVIKAATGIRDTAVWKKLFRFQRDGVIGAIDRLNRFGGCIIADSVGLGKTFEALAVIKYHELRNDRVLVLCPKRLRDNWTLYKANDRRNVLAADRLNYDVLNHTDLSRDGGTSGDIDLTHVNWGNYDLVVIDESHNFRNKAPHRDRDTRYDHLMKRIIKAGVKTKVLMLSATPVNNRLADLKNQIAFATEGNDAALRHEGIPSVEATVRMAQAQFNRWLALPEAGRKPARLIDMLGFDYFKLLDLLTIARSRKHVARYYGTAETGRFPDRLPPTNIKADVDLAGHFPAIRQVNNEIRRLNLAAYAPLRYVLPNKQAAYDAKYSTKLRGGDRVFRQQDREESLIHLLRVNILKRMESSVASFALTIKRQLADVTALIQRIEQHVDFVEELAIEDVDVDDPAFEALLVGRGVKVLLQDMDVVRWRQDLAEDQKRLALLLAAAERVTPALDAKLAELRQMITGKLQAPINPGNRKIIIFTAFADTAEYLYREVATWARDTFGIHTALVTGGGRNRTTLPKLRADLSSILTAFAPRAKERPPEMADEGEIDLLIATDCISEGQNLQDCDWLVNFDIHWNPVRIIQRFGRIDRIGSPNSRIQLVNFWPNMQLEEYINLEQRVSGRMVLLDISATGEENIIETQSGDQMNDLEYRRKQMEQLQETVIDLEDLSNGISIADLTLGDYRIELGRFRKDHQQELDRLPLGAVTVLSPPTGVAADIPPGVIFCLRAADKEAAQAVEPGYPLAPHYLVHVGDSGEVLLPYNQAKQILDRLKGLCAGQDEPDLVAWARFDRATKHGRDMEPYQRQLAAAVASIQGKSEERAAASLFSPGGTHARKGEFRGSDDFDVVAYVVALPPA